MSNTNNSFQEIKNDEMSIQVDYNSKLRAEIVGLEFTIHFRCLYIKNNANNANGYKMIKIRKQNGNVKNLCAKISWSKGQFLPGESLISQAHCLHEFIR